MGLVRRNLPERVGLFKQSLGFEGLGADRLQELARIASFRQFRKGEMVFHPSEPCSHFYIVDRGLIKVSICSRTGLRITYLLAERGEPLNLVGPFTGSPRFISAEALEDSVVAYIEREEFMSFAFKNISVIINILSILGRAVDSANSRIIDMMEKRVEQRLLRVLCTLHKKFGTNLKFTSGELAELAGTTTESALRSLSRLRSLGVIRSSRGQIHVVDPILLKKQVEDTLWV